MGRLKFQYFYMFAMLMFLAKPFVGFTLRQQHFFQKAPHKASILVKSFAKRKPDCNEESEFSLTKVKQRLANPQLPSVTLFVFALSLLLPLLWCRRSLTFSNLAAIANRLNPATHLYLLSGKLTI